MQAVSHRYLLIIALCLAIGWVGSSVALADEVIVKEVKPDQPKASPTPTATPGPTTPVAPSAGESGDAVIAASIKGLNLSEATKAKLQPALDAMVADDAATTKDFQRRLDAANDKLKGAWEAAKKAGSQNPYQDATVKTGMAECQKLLTDFAKTRTDRQAKFIEAAKGVLSAEQLAELQDDVDRASRVHALVDKAERRQRTRALAAGVAMSAEQIDQLTQKMQAAATAKDEAGEAANKTLMKMVGDSKVSADQRAAASAAHTAAYKKIRADYNQALLDALKTTLSAEQQKQWQAGRSDQLVAKLRQYCSYPISYWKRQGGFTTDQERKANDLIDAAAEQLRKMDSNDIAGQQSLCEALSKDLRALLTAEQKTKLGMKN